MNIMKKQNQQRGFSGFFLRHQKKVNPKKPVANVLSEYAEQDLERIAVLIKEWLARDEKDKAGAAPRRKPKR